VALLFKKDILKKSKFYLILLVLIALIPLLDFFKSGLPLTHDGQDHVARLASFYQSLSEGNLVPRWAGDLNWLYGTPVLMFFYPLPSYLGSFFHLFGFSFVNSVKMVFGLSFILSGVFMYLWIKDFLGEKAGFAAGLIYMFAPYRFVDLYVRGAIGECWGFVWPPLVCWFVLKSSKKIQWKYLVGGALSLAALILSHNALSLMFLPIIFGYMIFLVYTSPKPKRLFLILNSLFLILLGFGLASFFWFPAFFEGKYTLRDIVTKNEITGFETFNRLIRSGWNYGGTGQFSVQLGILQWLAVAAAPLLIWRFWQKKDKFWLFLSFLLIAFLITILMILPVSQPFYQRISLLQKFQFAWRFLSLALLPPAVFAGAVFTLLPKKFKTPALLLCLFASLSLSFSLWHPKDFLHKEESFYTENYPGSTNDTGESSPRWSTRAMYQFPKVPIGVIEGEAEIKPGRRQTTRHEYQIQAATSARIVENTLYFPGWEVLIDGQLTPLQFQDPAYRGLMTFYVTAGDHEVVVEFRETRLRQFANLISILGLASLLLGKFMIKFKGK